MIEWCDLTMEASGAVPQMFRHNIHVSKFINAAQRTQYRRHEYYSEVISRSIMAPYEMMIRDVLE